MSSESAEKGIRGRISTVCEAKSVEESMKAYDEYFHITYDDDMAKRRPENLVENFINFSLKSLKIAEKDIKIIDIGAGTGLVGMELTKHGFNNLYGHDGSSEMLKIAEKRDIYKTTYQEILFESKPSIKMPQKSFDVLFGFGIFM